MLLGTRCLALLTLFSNTLLNRSAAVLKCAGVVAQTMVMCMSLGYIGFVALLHIIGKVRLPVSLCSASHLAVHCALKAKGVVLADPRGVSTAKPDDRRLAARARWREHLMECADKGAVC